MSKDTVLVVEDEKAIVNFIKIILQDQGYRVIESAKGKEAISLAATSQPDLVILDLGLPDIDGIEVLRAIRAWSQVPVVVVSAREREAQKVEALDAGADDYITKPFGTREFLARVRTALRHRKAPGEVEEKCIVIGELHMDLERRQVLLGGQEVHLTPTEYRLIVLLARQRGKVLTHDMIMREIWGPYTNETQALRVNMANIRRKIEQNPAQPRYITTEVGVGYRMSEET